jgi:hypothetical protein
VNENQLNDKDVFLENYGGGIMVADYRDGDNAYYCGSDLAWRKQPITHSPFPDKTSALNALAGIGI